MNPEIEEKIYFYTEDLQVGYGGKQILNPVRIGIKKGEILTLVGPNGAGKSTILKSVAAQLPPLGGAVYLDGADLLGMKGTERARRMAVMFTEKVHAEWMTCRDVVAAGRYPYTGRFGVLSEEDWKAVDEAMEAVQVSELRERDFQTLSDGQRQRVMLARALCQEPELLLLDEPTSYLDIRYKLEFMSVLQELARRKKVAVILSIHELDLAERVSDWVLCVSPGQESQFGRPEEMLTPEHLSELFQIRGRALPSDRRQYGASASGGGARGVCAGRRRKRARCLLAASESWNYVCGRDRIGSRLRLSGGLYIGVQIDCSPRI